MIIRVDDIKNRTNGIVFGVMKKFTTHAGEAINKNVWKHLQFPAPQNCPYMQGDKDALNFSKLFRKNRKIKDSKFSKNQTGWYSESLFPEMPDVNKNCDDEP